MLRTTTLLLCLLAISLAGCPSPSDNPAKTGDDNPPFAPAEHPELSGDEKAAVAEIERLIGSHLSVGTDGEQDLKIDKVGHVIVVDLSGVEDPQKVNDAVLEHVGKLTYAQEVRLTSLPITDDGLAHLAGLSALKSLELSSTAITNAGLAHLNPLKNLRTLICRNTEINSRGSNDLKKSLPTVLVTHDGKPPVMPELSGADNATVAEIELLIGPLSFGIDGEPDLTIDEAGHVIVVDLSGKEKLNDAVLEQVGKLTHTQKLFLTSTPITDAGLAHLITLSELMNLELSSTAVTNAGLAHLKPLKNLHTVICRNTKINSAGSNELKRTLPKVLVTHDGKPSVP